MGKTHYKTIVISDTHFGNVNSNAEKVLNFLKYNTSDLLILNGDIIDMWSLKRGGKWTEADTKFCRKILKLTYKTETQVVYLRGNHDDFLGNFLPFKANNFSLKKDFIYESPVSNKKYYVVHGDIFDVVTTKLKWLSKLGGVGYDFLLFVNRIYNRIRLKMGFNYYSLSKKVKYGIKMAVNFISDYEQQLTIFAKAKGCQGVICGHIHHPEMKMIDGVEYLNSGDWVENFTALVEDHDGSWHILKY